MNDQVEHIRQIALALERIARALEGIVNAIPQSGGGARDALAEAAKMWNMGPP